MERFCFVIHIVGHLGLILGRLCYGITFHITVKEFSEFFFMLFQKFLVVSKFQGTFSTLCSEGKERQILTLFPKDLCTERTRVS
jgi:hypothetical protein